MGTVTAAITTGKGGIAPVRAHGNLLIVPVSFAMAASYATGGDTLTLPTDVKGRTFLGAQVVNRQDGTRFYDWNGSATAPKIKAYTAGNAEVANTTNLSSITLVVLLYYAD